MLIVTTDIQLSANFKLSEFVCHDGSNKVLIDMELVRKLQVMRLAIGQPIHINSGYRTPEWNVHVNGAPKSQHLLGKAADIHIETYYPADIAKVALRVGFNGIGIYTHKGNSFCHVDIRQVPTFWLDTNTDAYEKINAHDIHMLPSH